MKRTSDRKTRNIIHRLYKIRARDIRRGDRLDAWFMKDDSTLTQEEYDIAVKNLNTWAEFQFDHVTA